MQEMLLAAHDPFALLGRTAHSRIVEPPFGCVLLGTEEKKSEEASLNLVTRYILAFSHLRFYRIKRCKHLSRAIGFLQRETQKSSVDMRHM